MEGEIESFLCGMHALIDAAADKMHKIIQQQANDENELVESVDKQLKIMRKSFLRNEKINKLLMDFAISRSLIPTIGVASTKPPSEMKAISIQTEENLGSNQKLEQIVSKNKYINQISDTENLPTNVTENKPAKSSLKTKIMTRSAENIKEYKSDETANKGVENVAATKKRKTTHSFA